MIRPGDRVLLGPSGGKDSLSLWYILLHLCNKSPVKFELGAATVDPCIEGFDSALLKSYVPTLGIPYYFCERQDIVGRAQRTMRNDSFCAYGACMRRGVLSTGPPAIMATTSWCWRITWTMWPSPSS